MIVSLDLHIPGNVRIEVFFSSKKEHPIGKLAKEAKREWCYLKSQKGSIKEKNAPQWQILQKGHLRGKSIGQSILVSEQILSNAYDVPGIV